jgi:hypothetical protein
MQDDFTPIRYDLHHASGEGRIEPSEGGLYVGYLDFLVARQSRDHWKSKAERWLGEAQNQERCIQNVEGLLTESYKEAETLRAEVARLQADVKRLTSIIDLNTSDDGRDLVALTQRNGELIQMLAQINALTFKAISR